MNTPRFFLENISFSAFNQFNHSHAHLYICMYMYVYPFLSIFFSLIFIDSSHLHHSLISVYLVCVWLSMLYVRYTYKLSIYLSFSFTATFFFSFDLTSIWFHVIFLSAIWKCVRDRTGKQVVRFSIFLLVFQYLVMPAFQKYR